MKRAVIIDKDTEIYYATEGGDLAGPFKVEDTVIEFDMDMLLAVRAEGFTYTGGARLLSMDIHKDGAGNYLVPKARPRFNLRTGAAYMDKKYKASVKHIQMYAAEARGRMDRTYPYDGPVQIDATIHRRKPKKGKGLSLGDIDNIYGTILDAIQNIIILNDAYVRRATIGLPWAGENEPEHAEVEIYKYVGPYGLID